MTHELSDLRKANDRAARKRQRRVTTLPHALGAWLPRWETTARDRAGLRFGAIAGASFVAGVVFVISVMVAS